MIAINSSQATGLVGNRAASAVTYAAAAPVIEATAARLDGDMKAATITFELSAPVNPTVFVLADPDRAIVELPQVDFTANGPADKKAERERRQKHPGLVTSFRCGATGQGRSRIVVNLGAPARVAAGSSEKVGDHYELVVRLARTDRASFRATARSGTVATIAAADPNLPASPAEPDKTTIVLDPGHGGPDAGARVNGVLEKDVALAFARTLAAKLEADGRFNVIMTRSTDVFVPLSDRVRIARGANAALMVSIHADTLADAADVGGATVYTVSDKASDAYAAKVAMKENAADAAGGLSGQQESPDVNDILFDLTRQETRAYSHVFARTLVSYLKVAARLNKNPQRAAGFVVLKAPDVPSILLELGYLSNASDSAALTSDAWRERASGRMAEAIEAYFAERHAPAKAAVGVPLALRQ